MSTYGSARGWQVQVARGSVRIGDRERDEAAHALGEHFASGRLERDEYDERLSQVFAARTWSDLMPIFGDLPAPRPGQPAATAWPARTPRPSRPRRLPMFPVLVILVAAAAIAGNAWVFWLGLGGVFVFHKLQRDTHGHRIHSRGSCRTPFGNWA